MYNINMDIPGWNREEILTILAELSSTVPHDGNILELGALFGRTTYALGHNKPVDTKLHVIDRWPDLLFSSHNKTWFHDQRCGEKTTMLLEKFYGKDKISGGNFYTIWKYFTAGIPNIISYRNLTSMPNDDFPMMDLIVHDAGHDYKSVYDDLVHWFTKLKQNGCIIVDDYDDINFPELIKAVDDFVLQYNLNKIMVTSRNIKLTKK